MRMQQTSKENESRNKLLANEMNKIRSQFRALKQKMASSRNKQDEKLGDLTMNSKNCTDTL